MNEGVSFWGRTRYRCNHQKHNPVVSCLLYIFCFFVPITSEPYVQVSMGYF